MNKFQFLKVDFHSSVKLTPSEKKKIEKWLGWASEALYEVMKKKLLPHKKIKGLEVSLLICGDKKIQELNREYRHKNYVTDVLSFPNYENLRTAKPVHQGILFLGDLAICHQQTKRQAREFNITYYDEFIHLFFHGVLHLMGFDHEISAKEERLMENWEDMLLTKFSDKKKGA